MRVTFWQYWHDEGVINKIKIDTLIVSNHNDPIHPYEYGEIISENINNIELMDLCSVFSNLIDNAFNAAGKSKNKKVELYAWLNVGYMFVKTCNYPDETPDINEKKNKRGLTDKHGYGIEILHDLCEKYDGEFIFSSENDMVSAVCSLRY